MKANPKDPAVSLHPSSTAVHRSGLAAWFVAGGVFLSRLSGLAREMVFAHFLGTSPAAGAFRAAVRIPNLLQNLFGEGALSASFIPVYARLVGQGERAKARVVAGTVLAALAFLMALLVVMGMVLSPWLTRLLVPGFDEAGRGLTTALVRIVFLGTGLLVLSSWCLGVLNSHGKFFLSYGAPVVWNGAQIACLYGASRWLTKGVEAGEESLVGAAAVGLVLGSALQFACQAWPAWKAVGGLALSKWPLDEDSRTVFRQAIPATLSRGMGQLSVYVDQMISSFLGPAAVAALAYAQNIYLLPLTLVGTSIAAAELPALSTEAGAPSTARDDRLAKRLAQSLDRVDFLLVPAAMAFLTLGPSVAHVLFHGGSFRTADGSLVGTLLGASGIGLVANGRTRIYTVALYALGKTRDVLTFSMVRLGVSAGLSVLGAIVLRDHFGWSVGQATAALVTASSVAAWLDWALQRKAVGKLVGRVPGDMAALRRVVGSALVASFVGRLVPALDALPLRLQGCVRLASFGMAYGVALLVWNDPRAWAICRRGMALATRSK